MSRFRSYVGIAAGGLLVASSAAHSLLGWPQLAARLASASVPDDLVHGLAIGWHFGGGAMLVFGCIAISAFAARLRGRAAPMGPVLCIAVAHGLFGAVAMVDAGFDPFFLIFIVPAAMLFWAGGGRREAGSGAGRG